MEARSRSWTSVYCHFAVETRAADVRRPSAKLLCSATLFPSKQSLWSLLKRLPKLEWGVSPYEPTTNCQSQFLHATQQWKLSTFARPWTMPIDEFIQNRIPKKGKLDSMLQWRLESKSPSLKNLYKVDKLLTSSNSRKRIIFLLPGHELRHLARQFGQAPRIRPRIRPRMSPGQVHLLDLSIYPPGRCSRLAGFSAQTLSSRWVRPPCSCESCGLQFAGRKWWPNPWKTDNISEQPTRRLWQPKSWDTFTSVVIQESSSTLNGVW